MRGCGGAGVRGCGGAGVRGCGSVGVRGAGHLQAVAMSMNSVLIVDNMTQPYNYDRWRINISSKPGWKSLHNKPVVFLSFPMSFLKQQEDCMRWLPIHSNIGTDLISWVQ